MRSPWLSREYTLCKDLKITKCDEGYLIQNLELNSKLKISNEEYQKLIDNKLNEIEWEKYFLRGLAEDVNGYRISIDKNMVLPSEYKKKSCVRNFILPIKNELMNILINPDMGSWIALSKSEFDRYEKDDLSIFEWESLFLRGLCEAKNDFEFELEAQVPAEYPSVVVVNITTDCNLRCKYCFANCGEFKGEDMRKDVMEATVKNMLSMPVGLVTFEFQGGEASLNTKGIKEFIEIAESEKVNHPDKTVKYRTEINCVEVSDELIELLKKYNISTGFSCDGPKECNDLYRIDINGEGSFDRIMAGVKKLRDNGVEIDGSVCTIGQHNVKYPREIMKMFDDLGISFKPRPINVLGREIKNNLTTKTGEWAECYAEMYKMRNEVNIDNFSIHIFEENVFTPIRDYICLRYPCGAAREIISVNPDGTVYPCDGFKGVEKFVMGNILNETLFDMLNKPHILKLRDRTAKDIPQCSNCLFRGMCCSCCYSAHGKFGDIYREDPHCADKRQIYMFLMKTWLEEHI